MKLGGMQIFQCFNEGKWRAYIADRLLSSDEIQPLIGPNSIDVTLSPHFKFPRLPEGHTVVDPRNASSLAWDDFFVEGSCILQPGTFMLGAVNERFVCEHPVFISGREYLFAPMYEGRSSCGRLGLASHITAGFGDYGFGGAFTLEIYNHFPYALTLYPGMRIGQVAFESVEQPKIYKGAYSGSNHYQGPVEPKLGPDRF